MRDVYADTPGSDGYAGFWVRVFANVLDVLLLAAINQALLFATGGWRVFGGGDGHGIGAISMTWVPRRSSSPAFVPPVVIIGCWIALGASPGKLMFGLRIVDEPTGGRPTAWQCIGRYFTALIGILCAGLGYFWIVIDPRKQGLHDKVVRTLVVRRR